MSVSKLIVMSMCSCVLLGTVAQAAVFDVDDQGNSNAAVDTRMANNDAVKFDNQGNMIVTALEGSPQIDQDEQIADSGNKAGGIRLVANVIAPEGVPEPSSLVLLGVAAVGYGLNRNRKKKLQKTVA